MIIEEGRVLTLEDDSRYLIICDIGELEDIPNKKFLYAIGVTPDDDIDSDNTVFFQLENNGNEYTVEKVQENTELHTLLSNLAIITVAMESIPGYKEQLEEILQNN